jgi:hypothetical protein
MAAVASACTQTSNPRPLGISNARTHAAFGGAQGVDATNRRGNGLTGFAGGSDAATTTVIQPQFARSQKAVDLTGTDSQNLFAQIGICIASIAPVWRQPVRKHGLEPLAASLLVGFSNPPDHSRFGLFIDRRRPFARTQLAAPAGDICKKIS